MSLEVLDCPEVVAPLLGRPDFPVLLLGVSLFSDGRRLADRSEVTRVTGTRWAGCGGLLMVSEPRG